MKWRIYKEAIEEVNFKKLLKQNGVTKLPSGMKFSDTKAEWEKHRGHAGKKTIYNMCVQLEHAGWKRGDWTTGGIPDGSAVSNSEKYTSPDGQIVMSYYEYYGATAYDNSYYITFKLAGNQVNEADDSFTRGDRPQIRKVFSDEEFTVDEFVERIQEVKEEIEDIIIFNRDMYEDQDEPLKVFLADVCQGKHIEDALDLGFYMNQPAYDQLPEDIQKYVSFNTGTCNFMAQKWVTDIFNDMMDMGDIYSESSRFGFNVGDMVELTKDKSNTFTGETVKAGTQGEVVAVDKPMPGVIKVKIEGGKVVSVPERQLKFAGTDNEPWEKYKTPAKPKPSLSEILDKHGPEEIYMEPARPGYPKWTGD